MSHFVDEGVGIDPFLVFHGGIEEIIGSPEIMKADGAIRDAFGSGVIVAISPPAGAVMGHFRGRRAIRGGIDHDDGINEAIFVLVEAFRGFFPELGFISIHRFFHRRGAPIPGQLMLDIEIGGIEGQSGLRGDLEIQ